MLKLVKMERKYIPQLHDMMDEWTATGESIIPAAIRRCDYHDIDRYMDSLEFREPQGDFVPDSTFFCLDTERNIFVGAVNIRHYLNEWLTYAGGHIGDGIRPRERGKGYGTAMIALALDECRKMAETIRSKSGYAVSLAKDLIDRGMEMDLEGALVMEAISLGLSFASHDKAEGMSAFLEKRPAHLTDF